MAEFYEIEAITGNTKCLRVLDEICDRVMNGDDLYSVVASYLLMWIIPLVLNVIS